MIHDAIREGDFYGMQTFDQALLKLYEDGLITLSDASRWPATRTTSSCSCSSTATT